MIYPHLLYKQNKETYERIQKTIKEMFEDRGYIIDKKIQYINEIFEASLILSAVDKMGNRVDAFIIYKRMGKNEINKFFTSNISSNHILLISKDDFTSFAKQVLIEKRQEGMKIEFFLQKEVLYNITRHRLQPKFEIMTQDELQELLKQLQCKLVNLNKMLKTDPIARYFDAQPKQVFKITRDFLREDSHQRGINYRVVI